MAALLLAKARAAHRSQESGAVMFIVTMILTVLASVGIYALAAATNEVTTSGSERQAAQTHYLAEYGVVAGTQLMTATRAQSYLSTMLATPDTNCWSLPNVTATTMPDPVYRACTHVQDSEIAGVLTWSQSSLFPDAGAPTSTPDFSVEFTGLNKASTPPGYALDLHVCFAEMTASAYGTTLPPTAAGLGNNFGEGLETQRARILAGPVMGAICQ